MEYSEILKDVLAGKWVRPHKNHRWVKMLDTGLWKSDATDADINPCRSKIVIEKKYYSLNTWEIKTG